MKFQRTLTEKVAKIPNLAHGRQVPPNATLFFYTGQMGINTEVQLQDESFGSEARQALANIQELLKADNCTFSDVVNVKVTLARSLKNWKELISILNEYFGEHEPTRDLPLVTLELPLGAQVAISVMAAKVV